VISNNLDYLILAWHEIGPNVKGPFYDSIITDFVYDSIITDFVQTMTLTEAVSLDLPSHHLEWLRSLQVSSVQGAIYYQHTLGPEADTASQGRNWEHDGNLHIRANTQYTHECANSEEDRRTGRYPWADVQLLLQSITTHSSKAFREYHFPSLTFNMISGKLRCGSWTHPRSWTLL
jgi:hypothetical protein